MLVKAISPGSFPFVGRQKFKRRGGIRHLLIESTEPYVDFRFAEFLGFQHARTSFARDFFVRVTLDPQIKGLSLGLMSLTLPEIFRDLRGSFRAHCIY